MRRSSGAAASTGETYTTTTAPTATRGTATSRQHGSTKSTAPEVDTEPPVVRVINASPDRVWEDGPECVRLARTTVITVVASDESGVSDVTVASSLGDEASMSPAGTDTWTATLGPFPSGTVTGSSSVQLTVEATDAAGNTDSRTDEAALTLEACP